MHLLTIPKDTLLSVLYLLHIKDLLALQSTCSHLRNAVESRRIWLLELQRLVDVACIPAFPLYVDVNLLDLAVIRSLVVAAYGRIKAYKSLQTTGLSRSSSSRIITVSLDSQPSPAQSLDNGKPLLFYRLLPSSEVLIVADTTILEVFSIPEGIRVWSYFPSGNQEETRLAAFAFEDISKFSFRLVVVSCIGTDTLDLKLFTLHWQERVGKGTTEVQRIASGEINDTGSDIFCVCIGGDYVVVHVKHCLIVWNWKEEKMTEIILDEVYLHGLQVAREHLFHVLNSSSVRCSLRVASLRQFDDSASLLSYADVKCLSHEPAIPVSDYWMVAGPKLVLYDLQQFGISDEIKCVLILDIMSNMIRRILPVHININLGALEDTLFGPEDAFRLARIVQPILSDPFAPSSILVSSPPSCVVHDRQGTMPDFRIFRLGAPSPPSCAAHDQQGTTPDRRILGPRWSNRGFFLGFDERGEIFRAEFPEPTEAFDMVVEFDCDAIIQSFPNERPRRVVIHHLV